jgi:hypothetical protein
MKTLWILGGVLGAVAVASLASFWPEMKRYWRIESM